MGNLLRPDVVPFHLIQKMQLKEELEGPKEKVKEEKAKEEVPQQQKLLTPPKKGKHVLKPVLALTSLKSPKPRPLTQVQPNPSQFARSSRLDPKRLLFRTRK